MSIKQFLAVFLVITCSAIGQQAEAERAKIEAILRAPAVLELREIDRWALPSDIDRATIDERLKRLRGEWLVFLREKTEAGKAEEQRVVKSAALWSYIFNGGSDDAAWMVDYLTGSTNRLLLALKASMIRVEMEADATLRAKMTGRIASAIADLETWRKHDVNARSARGRMAFTLPALVKPL